MTDYTPLSRFRRFIGRVNDLSRTFGEQLDIRSIKTGGTTGQVPVKSSGTNFAWTWATCPLATTVTTNANLTGVVTSVGNATAIADGALSIAKTSGLQTALDAKLAKAGSSYADDAAAAIGGVAVGEIYKKSDGSVVWRTA